MVIMQQQATPPRSNPLKWILIGCVGLFLFGSLFVGGCFFLLLKATSAPVKAGEEFLQAMSSGDAARVRGLCDPGVPVEELLKETGSWNSGWTITGRYIETKNGVTTGRVMAQVPGKDGKARAVELQLVDSGGWKVMSVTVDGRRSGTAGTSAEASAPEIRNVDIQKEKIEGGWEVKVAFEVHGLRSEARGENKRIAATHGVLLKGPKGQDVIKNDDFKTIDGEANVAVATFTDTFTLTGKEAQGNWVLQATVRDHLGGATVTKDIEFKLP